MARRNSYNPYTHAERVALVTRIERLMREEGLTLTAAAKIAGTSSGSYTNWLRDGIRPEAPPPEPPLEPSRPLSRLRTAEERAALVEEVEALMAAGAMRRIDDACTKLGISEHSFYKWRRELRPPAMRPVEVKALVPVSPAALTLAPPMPATTVLQDDIPDAAPSAESSTLSLTAPGGYRVEGSTWPPPLRCSCC